MLRLTKLLFSLSNNDGIIKGHCMKIPDIIKLLKKNRNINKEELDNINVQIINTINNINPQKIINNIIFYNKREKQDLNFLKKKILFNHLLLREIVNYNNNITTTTTNNNYANFQLYESKDDLENEININGDAANEKHPNFINTPKSIYGRYKRKSTLKQQKETNIIEKEAYNYVNNFTNHLNEEQQKKEEIYGSYKLLIHNDENKKVNFSLYELKNNYKSFILDNILINICSYIYNYKILNKINKSENNRHELVSVLLISNVFRHFFELKFGYTYIIHFLSGLSLYRIKKDINNDNINFKIIDEYITNQKEGTEQIFEKEYDISYIFEYLEKYGKTIEQNCINVNRSNLINKNFLSNNHDSYIYKFEDDNYKKKKKKYIINTKDNILIQYNIDESYLHHFLNILANKYNIDKMSFSNFSQLMHMYTMSNYFVINFFSSFPILFLKNKMDKNINTLIMSLNSCIFFLKGKSYINPNNPFHIYIKTENDCKEINDQNSHIDQLKEKIYSLVEQIINYLYINKEIMNNNHLLQILEILSYINYNKTLFSYIFKKINNGLCLLDKYKIFFFLNSLSNYDIVYNQTKNKIYRETIRNIDNYSSKEIRQLEKYLQIKY
ncbi:conserved Plasmodium protein, unknown function [Plasmodium berghei]|uniref:Uncharacterized protein n=2 Tax=Plasmodium berghei TaxID=5821 RepID=A0A509AJP5_PLABA|nr:conserved Plasmodium protein, unknown function [Plasmodium berghei ANKA]CXI41793.1 conserved Plasmodium protein, unknown function [Plasmodium berghei]SCM21987.1 conserved Plasmodium protein, unknown function [Plasmodium berghei]SCN25206.1 conserved Plasmodium protein, unknown function [Plasmodium berghei]SCO60203.1 conserved Plasmodium protein, unknown function [Plasmodium berghei]SCO61816.1 conserved Plasmodium protein, unknown function [Plasmodium berghei]|eukprot:XP_034421499.1 conserved Plasmodium protein, unknown function [Plasmodium berghei ANKA]